MLERNPLDVNKDDKVPAVNKIGLFCSGSAPVSGVTIQLRIVAKTEPFNINEIDPRFNASLSWCESIPPKNFVAVAEEDSAELVAKLMYDERVASVHYMNESKNTIKNRK